MALMQARKADHQSTEIQFYLSSSKAWQAMYRDCRNAKKSIEVEQYMLRPDILGMRFIRLFQKKVSEGVTVKLRLDKIGSYELFYSSALKEMREKGVEVYFYNAISFQHLLHPSSWFPRDHIKTMLIDDEIAYTGGVCFDSRMLTWRDTQARFTGSQAKAVRCDLDHVWKREKKRQEKKVIHAKPNYVEPFDYITSAPQFRRNPIYQMLRDEIDKAKKEICIATPYFIPPRKLIRILRRASARGVNVKLIVTKYSDHSIADYVAQTYFHRLYRAGIKIFSYTPTTLHAKYWVIDDEFGMIGSTNVDYLSLMHNREASLIIRDEATVKTLREHFETDLVSSEEYSEDVWRKRPLINKIIGFLFRPMRRFM